MISCGWCGHPTLPDLCGSCGHVDPARPWLQRGMEPPTVDRPTLDRTASARRIAAATQRLGDEGRRVTIEALAEVLDVSPRTVRRWRDLAG